MCKHKSGGMSKPSGAATHQGAIMDRNVSTYPSQSSTSALTASASQSNSIHNQIPPGALFDTQAKGSPLNMPSVSRSDHLHNEADNHIPNFALSNASVRNPIFQNTSVCPDVPEAACGSDDSKSDDSEDEDVITELSPMLLSCNFPDTYPQPDFWKNGCGNGDEYVADAYQHSSSVSEFGNAPCDGPYFLPYVMNNKSVDLFKKIKSGKYRTYNICEPVKGDSWIVPSQENVQDSGERNCSESPLLCVYSANGNEVDGYASPIDSNSLMTDTYSSSTMNTDPLPGPSGLQRHNSVHWEVGVIDSDKDEEFRMRSYSLTPTVNFAVFESESTSENEDNAHVFLPALPTADELQMKEEQSLKVAEDMFQIPVSSFGKVFPISPSAAQLSLASSYGDSGASICKICHMTAKENDPLISPCRCSGTMQYIHCGCLMRWLEISSKRSRKPASCELCQYQYHWHKKFKVRHWQFPHCSRKDKILHMLFFIAMITMIACATITILCFKQDKGTKVNPDRTELTQSEIITLVCGVTFFLAFFVAMYVEVKSHSTIYKLLVKFIYLNQQWYIDEYEKKESAPVAV